MKDIYRYLSRCLGTKIRVKRKIKEIAIQLYTIDKGFKLGFLWDVGCLSMDEVRNLLDSLKQVKLIQNTLAIVQIGLESGADFGVCDVARWFAVGQQSRPVFIDVSAELSSPRTVDQRVITLHNDLVDLLQTRLAVINQSSSMHHAQNTKSPLTQIVQWPLDNDVCRTSAYGLFIGYPIIYWYETTITRENCLSQISLAIFQAGIKPQADEPFEPFVSFSVPAMLLNEPAVETAIASWKESIARNNLEYVTCSEVFNNVIM
uniref:Uncharacterized protein n=1 Tax=Anopheles culicifacies TaxID=139723 RepID=A0A2C9GUH6_9DIPT